MRRLEVAMITPPVGLAVFVLESGIGDPVRPEDVFRGIGPFLPTDVVPWLPRLVYG